MALQLASVGARVKAFIPTWLILKARAGKHFSATAEAEQSDTLEQAAAPIAHLSPETKAVLASLELPPDGPINPGAALRARLTPDTAARNFVTWARALNLTGRYSRRDIYALYCEFSEVDERPPLSSTRFLAALDETEGVTRGELRNGKVGRAWQWTIEPVQEPQAAEAAAPTVAQPGPAVPVPAHVEPALVVAEPPANPLAPAKPAILLPRFVLDADHPFSPAGLREGAKNARRHRLNAAAARKQRGALRRVA